MAEIVFLHQLHAVVLGLRLNSSNATSFAGHSWYILLSEIIRKIKRSFSCRLVQNYIKAIGKVIFVTCKQKKKALLFLRNKVG